MFSNVQTQDVSEFGSLEVCQNAEATPWCQPPKQKRKGHCSAWSSFWDSEGHGSGQQEPPTQHGVYKYKRSQNGNFCWNLCHGTLSKKERGGGNVETQIRAGVPSFSIQKPSQKCWMSCFHVSLQFTAGSPFYPGKKLNSTEKHTKADNFEELRAVTYLMAVDISPLYGLTINGWWWWRTWPANPGNCINCIFKDPFRTLIFGWSRTAFSLVKFLSCLVIISHDIPIIHPVYQYMV